ncbi:MAG TPA: hypothetical protein VHU84_07330 [Lacipirellulaceae bacterium]|jgi:hypothetical protein|nr:hypothetical protein [Lacipirellulaceae bacterium]
MVSAPPAPVFSAPPGPNDEWGESPVVGTCAPAACAPPREAWHVQSYFMPSLGRYGLVAPRTPGSESVHSAYTVAPPYGPPSPCANLFCPPPCAGSCEASSAAASNAPPGPVGQQPCIDGRSQLSTYSSGDFSPDPCYDHPYNTGAELGVYGDKHLNPTQRPLIEWGFPLYDTGPVPPPSLDCGPTNPSLPRFYVYGDYRVAAAYNDPGTSVNPVIADRINLEADLWMTSTERFHVGVSPFQRDGNFQRIEFEDGRGQFHDSLKFFDAGTDTAFFEGDLGYMLGGWTGKYSQLDLPVTVGLIPLLFQNGIWMDDAIVGAAMSIPARNNPYLDWSNFDITFFTGFDQVTSPAFDEEQSGTSLFGTTAMIEAKGGYIELGYAFLDDREISGRSYNNIGISYTRRYLNLLSNSMRAIVNTGQGGATDDRTANGVLLLAENSFLTRWPYNVIPYVNMWTGFDDPQSVARAGAAGGVLRNTGILFESDNLTNYPTLDASGSSTYGAAIGIDLLSPEFTHQLILEAAALGVFGDPDLRNAAGNEYGIGARYQVPISNATLLRFDVMHGFFDNAPDVSGARAEFRWKF